RTAQGFAGFACCHRCWRVTGGIGSALSNEVDASLEDGQRRDVLRARPPLGAWAGGCAAFAARSCLSFAPRRRRARRRSRRTAWLVLEWEWLIRTPPLMD